MSYSYSQEDAEKDRAYLHDLANEYTKIQVVLKKVKAEIDANPESPLASLKKRVEMALESLNVCLDAHATLKDRIYTREQAINKKS
jgi:hypothetical protein